MQSRLEVVHENNILRLARAHLELKQAMAACAVSGRVVAKEAAAARKAALANAKKQKASTPGGKPRSGLLRIATTGGKTRRAPPYQLVFTKGGKTRRVPVARCAVVHPHDCVYHSPICWLVVGALIVCCSCT